MTPHAADGPVRETRFDNPQLDALGIEVMTLSELYRKVPREVLTQPERVDLFILAHVVAGQGQHWLDFEEIELRAGSLMVVRPGQVQCWPGAAAYSATLVLIDPIALPYWSELSSVREGDLLALIDWQTVSQTPPSLSIEIATTLARLQQDIDAFDGSELELSLIRHEFLVLMLRIARWQRSLDRGPTLPGRQLQTYRLFLRELETSFRSEHSLRYYAGRLGYSESTLSRSCHAAEGRPAKTIIDRRITLEAKRILAHTRSPVAEIGHRLGFSEPTNFVKFFRRNAGMTPARFRQLRS